MALFNVGMKCPICLRPIERGEARRGFPHFLRGRHSLSPLSDAVVHVQCFEGWEHRAEFLRLLERVDGISHGAQKIRDPEERRAWLDSQWQQFAEEAARCDPGWRRPS